jgi:sugar lactone lactonase YvrE
MIAFRQYCSLAFSFFAFQPFMLLINASLTDGHFFSPHCFLSGCIAGRYVLRQRNGGKTMFNHTVKFLSVCIGSAAFLLSYSGMSACRAQNLLVSEYFQNDAVEFAPDGTNLGIFASAFDPGLRFEGMAFDANGYLYVASGGIPAVVRRFSPSGTDLGIFATLSDSGADDIAFDKAGNLYVSGYTDGNVERFSPTGVDLGVFASPVPNATYMAFDQAGDLYVCSDTAHYVRRFSPTGTDLGIFASGFTRPSGIAFDTAGDVYITDRLSNSVRRFAPDGTDLGVFADTGLDDPLDLAFDAAGNLYVSNVGGSTVRRFSPTGVDLGDFATGLHAPAGLAFFPQIPTTVPEPGALALCVGIGLSAAGSFYRRLRCRR